MKTEILTITGKSGTFTDRELEDLKAAGEVLKKGGLVAFPTETVYGLGGDAMNPESSRKIYAAKGRPSDNPLIVHIYRMEDLEKVASDISENTRKLAEAFWPGPLTMILPKRPEIPSETTGGLNTVAVRMPSDPVAAKLIESAGGFVAAPSANLSGKPSPTLAKYVIQDMDGRIDVIIDGGENEIGLESTIVDMTVDPPQVLRPGYITNEMIGEVLGLTVETDRAILAPDSGIAPKAPGMKYRHYAPKGALTVVEGTGEDVVKYINRASKESRDRGEKVGVIATSENRARYEADVILTAGSASDQDAIAHHLYSILREFDDENVTRIYSESFAKGHLSQAIMNRLLKAAGHSVVYAGKETL